MYKFVLLGRVYLGFIKMPVVYYECTSKSVIAVDEEAVDVDDDMYRFIVLMLYSYFFIFIFIIF